MEPALARMVSKDLPVSCVKTQTNLAATAMKLVTVFMDSATVGYLAQDTADQTAVTWDIKDRTVT